MSERPLSEATPAYFVGKNLCALVLLTWNRLKVEGSEKVPRGGVLLVANHQSFLDIPVVATAMGRRHVGFVARETLADNAFLKWLMRESRAVLIKPGAADRAALRAMVTQLEAGDVVAVYPEGTRSSDGTLGEFRGGALFAARRAGVPVVPVGIRGAFQALPRGTNLLRPRRIGVRFGDPLDAQEEGVLERARAAISGMIGDGTFDSGEPVP